MTIADVNKILAGIRTQIGNLLGQGTVTLVDDAPGLQMLQCAVGALDETRSGCVRLQEFGFSSVPLPGAHAVLVYPSGSRDSAFVLAVDDSRYRVRLQGGEVSIFSADGDRVTIKRGGTIEIHASGALQITSPSVTISGDLTVSGDIASSGDVAASGDVKAGAISLKNHKHTGVTAGGAQTGPAL